MQHQASRHCSVVLEGIMLATPVFLLLIWAQLHSMIVHHFPPNPPHRHHDLIHHYHYMPTASLMTSALLHQRLLNRHSTTHLNPLKPSSLHTSTPQLPDRRVPASLHPHPPPPWQPLLITPYPPISPTQQAMNHKPHFHAPSLSRST